MSPEEIAAVVRQSSQVFTTASEWAPFYATNADPSPGDRLLAEGGDPRLIKVDAENQICIAPAGVPLQWLQTELSRAGLSVPFPLIEPSGAAQEGNMKFALGFSDHLSLRQAIDLNLPHAAEAQSGNWRDWIIGMTVVLGDGVIAKSGSEAVKSVAGYDAHKLFIGARGTLGIVAEVILRVRPLHSRVRPELIWGRNRGTRPYAIHRVLPSDFAEAVICAGEDLFVADPESATIWRKDGEAKRFPHDWLLREGFVPSGHLYDRAKRLLDPENKLNPARP